MAARRGTRAGKSGGRAGRRTGSTGGRKRGRPSAGSRGGTRRTARRASPPVESARQLTAEDASVTELPVVMEPVEGGDGEARDASRTNGTGAAGTAEEASVRRAREERAAWEARRIEEAAAEIERRREAEGAAFRAGAEERPALPGFAGLAVELLIGGLRLVRAVVTAPLRLGRALLERAA